MKRFAFFFTAGLGIVLAGCGSLDSDTSSAPTLATVEGSLLNPTSGDVSTSSAVRVAVVWRGIGPGRFSVAEDLPVQPVFPSDFTIALSGPPPADAMNAAALTPVIWCEPDSGIPVSPECALLANRTSDASAYELSPDATPPIDTPTNPGTARSAKPSGASQFAVGAVVAYLDLNHNGKLDLVPDDASAYVDQILAANSDMTVVYLQGPIPDDTLHDPLPFAPIEDGFGHRATDGYNLLVFPQCLMPAEASPYPTCPTGPAVPAQDAGACAPMQWLGMNTPYPLTVASSPEVASLMCLDQTPSAGTGVGVGSTVGGMAPPYNPAIQPAQYPPPSDPAVCCAPDDSYYLYTTCTETSLLCQGTNESCTSVGYERPTPIPAAWPCTK